MPRKKQIQNKNLPFHIYARSNNQDWFYLPIDETWSICLNMLFTVTVAYGLRIHAFTLMSNHFHLLASSPFQNLGQAMNYLMREISREVNHITKRTNHVFGSRYKACLIEDPYYYYNAFRYIYQNPVRANICGKVEEYPFSTLRVLFGQDKRPLPLYPSLFDFRNPIMNEYEKALPWLNRNINSDNSRLVSLGLKKSTFSLPINRKTRKAYAFMPEDIREIDALLNQK
jgi:putative transposase